MDVKPQLLSQALLLERVGYANPVHPCKLIWSVYLNRACNHGPCLWGEGHCWVPYVQHVQLQPIFNPHIAPASRKDTFIRATPPFSRIVMGWWPLRILASNYYRSPSDLLSLRETMLGTPIHPELWQSKAPNSCCN